METTQASATASGTSNADWNYHPDLPIPTSPLFVWPPRPREALNWLAASWLSLSMIVLELAAAVLVYVMFLPELATMQTVSVDWIVQIWLRNLILLFLVAHSMHLYFCQFRKQGTALKYDRREIGGTSGRFTFNSQLLDNMFWSLASGVTIWTAYEVAYFLAAANDLVPLVSLSESPVWFVVWLLLIPIWSSLHFYWIHRLLHWPPLYRLAHSLHHRNINVGPWSGISMHPVEHVLYFSSLLIHFVVPSHPIHFLFHAFVNGLNPAASHSGFEGLVVREEKRFDLGDFFHQLHHRYFECNYGTAEMPWDVWFGSFHDGSDRATAATRARRSRTHERPNAPPSGSTSR